jgi:hypothetical protein
MKPSPVGSWSKGESMKNKFRVLEFASCMGLGL